MISEMETRIQTWANDLPHNAVDLSTIARLTSGNSLKKLSHPELLGFLRSNLGDSLLLFRYADIELLGRDGRRQLMQSFQNAILQRAETLPGLRTSNVISPATYRHRNNIIAHEVGHIWPLPKEVRQTAFIDLTLARLFDGSYVMWGDAWYDASGLSWRQRALASSGPFSLSSGDIDHATQAARLTGDRQFERYIQKRIKNRKRIILEV